MIINIMNNISDIKHSFYINLASRPDRKQHVEEQLKKISVNAQRFNAIKLPNGALGCSMSHLKCLETAKQNNWSHLLVVEDDIKFLDPELFKTQLNKFFTNHSNWDVVLIGGNNVPPYQKIDDTCVKVSSCQTTTGYLVNGHYFDTLIENFRTGIKKLMENPESPVLYAIDKYWFNLQKIHNWYLIIPLTVTQREDYSDIEKRATNYTHVMTDLDKEWFFKPQQQSLQSSNKMSQLSITSEPIKNKVKMNAETNKPSTKINMKI
jgi:GR25 family glycosyltransferase involved in LPS biosynthesis